MLFGGLIMPCLLAMSYILCLLCVCVCAHVCSSVHAHACEYMHVRVCVCVCVCVCGIAVFSTPGKFICAILDGLILEVLR